MTRVLEHLSRNPNKHTLSRGDALSKDTEHPWVFSYITCTDTGSYYGNIFSKCLLSISGAVNLGKSLTFLGLSLLIYKMGGIDNSSLAGLPWRLNELTCIQQGLFSRPYRWALQGVPPSQMPLCASVNSKLPWVTPASSLLSQPWSYLHAFSHLLWVSWPCVKWPVVLPIHLYFIIIGSLSMEFQECLLVSNIFWVWLFLKNVLSHCFSLLHLHPSLSAKMVVDLLCTFRPHCLAWRIVK